MSRKFLVSLGYRINESSCSILFSIPISLLLFFLVNLFKKSKKILTIALIISYSCKNKANENHQDILKIKNGMSFKQVSNIMKNKPLNVRFAHGEKSFFVSYNSHFASSGDIYIEYRTKDSIVVNTYIGD